MTRRGTAYELPTSAHPMGGGGSSSARGPLLKTPTVQVAVNGGTQHPDKRRAGGHGATLADEVEHLLPTPKESDGVKGGPNQRGSSGDLTMPSVVQALLPTPTTRDWKDGPPNDNVPVNALLGRAVWLLPTPRASDGPGESSHNRTWSATDRNLHTIVRNGEIGSSPTGVPTPPPSDDGALF
jgi:hypothetical protein